MYNMLFAVLIFLVGSAVGEDVGVKLLSRPPDACDAGLRPRIIGSTPVTISSPNYPDPYPSNARCEWQVTTTSEFLVVTFDAFQLEYCAGCTCDSLFIYDGSDANAPLLDFICNDDPANLPTAVISTGQTLFIVFTSDATLKTQTGFMFRVSGPSACETGNRYPEKITNSVGWLATPDYPANYPFEQNCAWTLTAPTGQRVELYFPDRVHFEEYCWADYVDIYDGPDAITSPRFGRFFNRDHPPIIRSNGVHLTLHFVSDNWENRPGFNVSYKHIV